MLLAVAQVGESLLHVRHLRLEVGVGVVPELHEPGIIRRRFARVVRLLVQLAEAAVCVREQIAPSSVPEPVVTDLAVSGV